MLACAVVTGTSRAVTARIPEQPLNDSLFRTRRLEKLEYSFATRSAPIRDPVSLVHPLAPPLKDAASEIESFFRL